MKEKIIKELKLDSESILNIYPYGSHVYGTNDEISDRDFVIVHKRSFITGNYNEQKSFKNNAISSEDGAIQGIRYSRAGFLSGIDTYDISALECLFLSPDKIIQEEEKFHIRKFEKKQLVKKIITKASNSWYLARKGLERQEVDHEKVEKGIFHALRILMFGIQLKENQTISDYSVANYIREEINEEDLMTKFKMKSKYLPIKNELIKKIKS